MADSYYDQTVLFLPFEKRTEFPGSPNLIYDFSKYNARPSVTSSGGLSATSKYGTQGFSSNGFLNESQGISLDYLSRPLALGTADFTVEGWFRTNHVASNVPFTLIDAGRDLSATSWRFYVAPTIQRASFNTGAGTTIIVGNTTLATGTWYHLAVTRSAGLMSIWVNGSLDATPVVNTTSFTASSNCLSATAPGFSSASGFYMFLDDLRVTVGVARYTSSFTPTEIPLSDYPLTTTFTPRNIQIGSSTRVDYKDPYFGSQSITTAGTISGIVKNGAVPVKRRVRLYESSTGNFVREVWAGLDGTFVFKGLDKNKRFTITSHDHLTGYNDVIAARATPV